MSRSDFVKSFQKELLSQFPNGFQSWWPNFIFHYSDVTNITSVLNIGKLYSRHKAVELGLMQNDNANDTVISNTTDIHKDYVRCYFGAKTPTQFHNEGIKPPSRIKNNAHCPVPVFLLFDFVKLLSKDDVEFSGGNIAASGADIYNTIEQLGSLEFNYIYNREALQPDSYNGHIIYCRHAEVLIPNELDVYEYLKFICVRSEAEKETLLHGLDDNIKEKISGKIKIFTKDGIFFNDRLFVNSVRLSDNEVSMSFSNADRNEFEMRVIAKDYTSGKDYDEQKTWKVPSSVTWKVPDEIGSDGFYICIELNGNIVYENVLFNREEGVI